MRIGPWTLVSAALEVAPPERYRSISAPVPVAVIFGGRTCATPAVCTNARSKVASCVEVNGPWLLRKIAVGCDALAGNPAWSTLVALADAVFDGFM